MTRKTGPSPGMPAGVHATPAAGLCLWLLLSALAGDPAAARDRPDADALQAVFPQAERIGPFEGDPPAARAHAGGELVGYVFRSRAVVQSLGYSGKPLDVLAGVSRTGEITGARILEHHEPILTLGVSSADLQAFADRLSGHDVRQPIQAVPRPTGPNQVDAVQGATISASVIADAAVRAARAVARSRGLLGGAGGRLKVDAFEPAGWPALLADGSLARLQLTVGAVETRLGGLGARRYPEAVPISDGKTFVDLYSGLATPARIGRNLLGRDRYAEITGDLPVGAQLIFVAARGSYSPIGTAHTKTGTFRRFQIVQGAQTHTFTADQRIRIERLTIEGAPDLRERALFVLPPDSGFDPSAPWHLELMVSGTRTQGEGTVFTRFELPYDLPERYLAAPAGADTVALWQQRWAGKRGQIAVLGAALFALTAILVFQDQLARRRRLFAWLRPAFLVFTLVWIGWVAGAQLSVVNVLTFGQALRTDFDWRAFLLDPLIFILWGYVAVSLLFWGRGVFCGWLCPFGAAQELIGMAARTLRVPQATLPFSFNERLWPIKYVVFIALFALSLGSMTSATQWAEVEPFKTAIVLDFQRDWPYVAYAAGLLALSAFIERPFCRYLCPLGGALAIPARLRMFEWLKRRPQCGTQCHICYQACPVQAIHPNGHINPNECIYCLKCQVVMYDDHVCPPLVHRRKRRESRQAARAERAASADDGAEGNRTAGAGR
jgi:transcriptional regulator of nitric oxide reductase/NAD-dependent dihydropyrimidine dehydrogenase PreA subunit